jgi:hypothetical protein
MMGRVSPRTWPALGAAAFLAAALALPGLGHAQGNLQAGPFRILPTLDLSGEYNDNVLLAPRDELDDFIWTISPGLVVELPARRSAARLGYRADIKEYVDHDELSTVDHTGQFDGRLLLGTRLETRLFDEFRRVQGFPGDPVPEVNQLVEWDHNTLTAGAEYRVSDRITLGGEFRWFLIDYDEALFDDLNHDEYLFTGTLYYRVLPKTAVLGEYRYEMIRYDEGDVARDRDSDGHYGLVGIRGDLTAKTSVQVKGGVQYKDFDSPDRDDFTGFVLEGETIWKYAEPSQLRLYVGRANVESLFLGNNYYVTTYGGLEVRHHLTPTVLLRATALYGVADYPDATPDPSDGNRLKDRSDDFVQAGVGVQYQIRRWVSVGLDYAYGYRGSNFDDFDYTNNRVWATVKLAY